MKAELFWIPECPLGRLAIMPRPRAGDWLMDEAISWRQQGLNLVVSLLEDEEISELGLDEEANQCQLAGLQFLRLPISDRGEPEATNAVSALVATIIADLTAGKGVGIHCRIGVGRSALLAACVLAALDLPIDSAWSAIASARGMPVPDTAAQRAWVTKWYSSFQSTGEGVARRFSEPVDRLRG